jgi:hypothetical protein
MVPFERGIAVSGACLHANHFYCLALPAAAAPKI